MSNWQAAFWASSPFLPVPMLLQLSRLPGSFGHTKKNTYFVCVETIFWVDTPAQHVFFGKKKTPAQHVLFAPAYDQPQPQFFLGLGSGVLGLEAGGDLRLGCLGLWIFGSWGFGSLGLFLSFSSFLVLTLCGCH
jgi:hypothetical protein